MHFLGVRIRYFFWWCFQILFILLPLLGEVSQFDEHIFQMGWFNHQLPWEPKTMKNEGFTPQNMGYNP